MMNRSVGSTGLSTFASSCWHHLLHSAHSLIDNPPPPIPAIDHQYPLLLYGCGFDWTGMGVGGFRRSPALQAANCDVVERILDEQLVRAGLLWGVVERLRADRDTTGGRSSCSVHANATLENIKGKGAIPSKAVLVAGSPFLCISRLLPIA